MNIHIYNDICEAVKKKCFESHGGNKFLGMRFLSKEAKVEYERIMKLPFGELLKYV